MKKIICFIITALYTLQVYSQFVISGTNFVEEKSQITEIKQIFVCQNLTYTELTYSFSGASSDISCWSYSKGQNNVTSYTDYRIEGNRIIFNNIKDETAYGVKVGDSDIQYTWLIDYSNHALKLNSVEAIKGEDACTSTKLLISAETPPLTYYSSSGYFRELQREYSATYESMTWDDNEKKFINTTITETKGIRIPETILSAPVYKNTTFKITGDQYLTSFGKPQSVESPLYNAVAVSCAAIAKQTSTYPDNHLGSSSSSADKEYIAMPVTGDDTPIAIEGSAPLNLDLTATGTIPAAFSYSWEIASDPDFMDLEAQITNVYPLDNDATFKYPFERAGTFYVRLVTSNHDNSCETSTNSFQITVFESKLEVPNAFSPGSDGINDVFKVAYQSIIKFKAWVFNRWGNQLYHWTDPAEGWDGTFNGKIVPPGVYFYVIDAVGSDGRKYKLKGDINLFHESKK